MTTTQTSEPIDSWTLTVVDDDEEKLAPRHRRLIEQTLQPLLTDTSPAGKQLPEKTLRDLEWPRIIELVAEQAQTPEGHHILRSLLPLRQRDDIEHRLREVAELMELFDTDSPPPLGGLHDIRKALMHVVRDGTLVVEDLAAIRRNCDVAARVHRYFESRTEPLATLAPIGGLVDPCRRLRRHLSNAIEPGGEIADAASPDLADLRRAVQNQHDRIRTRIDQLLRADRFQNALRDDYFTIREDRYVIPIRVGAKGEINGIVHGYSSTGKTAFIEPNELIELNNRLRWAQIELQDEIDRILEELSRLVERHAPVLFRNIELLAYLDVVCAFARFGRTIDAATPSVGDTRMQLHRARHPLLYLKHDDHKRGDDAPDKTVPNDIAIEPPRKALIISGPNTGGKTVTLKTAGLCALMVRFGLPIPADEDSSIPLYDSIFTDIGDEQSIQQDLSTFSGHVTNINSFIDRCGPDSLVLLDELFVGTDPSQGAALAVALLEDLATKQATTIVTTHLEGLKTLAYQEEEFANASMGFDMETLSPTYQMTLGIPGRSYAVRIASRLGLADSIVDRTNEILAGEDHQDIEEVLERLEDQIQQLEDEKQRLRRAREDAERREQRFRDKYQRLLDKDREELFDETRQLRTKLRDARDKIREQLKKLQAEKTVERGDVTHRDLQKMQDELDEAADTVDTARDKTRPPEPGPEGRVAVDPEELEEGMQVFCQPFNREGEVLSVDEDAEEVRVQLGDLKASVGFDDLFHASEQKRRAHSRGQSTGRRRDAAPPDDDSEGLLPQTDDNTVDLRGLRVDEALERVDMFLDSAYLKDRRAVYIIHGKGTGALRRAIRGHLPQSRYVERFRRGEREEGGNGVTVAFLKQ